MVWVVGTLDPDPGTAHGTLRVEPDPRAVVPLVLIVLLAIASQFLPTTFWVRLGLPGVAVLAIANFIWQKGVEWRWIAYRLKAELQITIDQRPNLA